MILCIARRCEKGSQANGLGTFFLPLSNFADQHNDPADRGRDKKLTLIVQEQVYAFFRADQLDQVMVVLHSTAHGFLQSRPLIFRVTTPGFL